MAGIHYLDIPKNCPGCGEVWMEHDEGKDSYRFAHGGDCPVLPWLEFIFQAYWIPTMGSTTELDSDGGPPIPLPPSTEPPPMPTKPADPQRIDKGPMPGDDVPRREPIQRFEEGEKTHWLACGARQCGNMFVRSQGDPSKPVCRVCGNNGLFFAAAGKHFKRYDGT